MTATDPTGRVSHLPDFHRGASWKQPVVCATTANITLSGTQTIDGRAVIAGERVLVKDQTTGSQNGILVCASGAWTRAFDMDQDFVTAVPAEEVMGAAVYVIDGTVNGGTFWRTTNTTAPTLGTTTITWTQFAAGASLTIKDEGSSLATAATSIDFVGAGVTATGTGAGKTVTIPGGSTTLAGLTDVTLTSPVVADRLRYDGTVWRNSALIWRPMTTYDPTSGLWVPLVDGNGNAIMAEA